MKIEIINEKVLESLLSESAESATVNDAKEIASVLACDSGCGCDTGSDWVNQICPAPEWVVGWKKSTC